MEEVRKSLSPERRGPTHISELKAGNWSVELREARKEVRGELESSLRSGASERRFTETNDLSKEEAEATSKSGASLEGVERLTSLEDQLSVGNEESNPHEMSQSLSLTRKTDESEMQQI